MERELRVGGDGVQRGIGGDVRDLHDEGVPVGVGGEVEEDGVHEGDGRLDVDGGLRHGGGHG